MSRTQLEILAGVVLAAILAIGVFEYVRERELRITAEATATAQKTVQADYAKQFADLQKQMADRDAAYASSLKTLDAKFAQAATPQQMADMLSKVMGFREPITISTPTPSAQNPQPSQVATIPAIDFPQAKSYVQACEECSLERTKLQGDIAARQAQQEIAAKQIESLKTQSAAWEKAAKGGSVLQRTVKALKYIGIGALVGAGAVCGSGHCR